MTKLFIGGSRRINRLSPEVQGYLDQAIQNREDILIGDANGADKAVQIFLKMREYEKVELFCVEGKCRNNLGKWKVRSVSVPKSKKGFDYYTTKDRQMAEEATRGLMIWDGQSRGTLTQIFRLVTQGKGADVYIYPLKKFIGLRDESDWEKFVEKLPHELREKSEGYVSSEKSNVVDAEQGRLI